MGASIAALAAANSTLATVNAQSGGCINCGSINVYFALEIVCLIILLIALFFGVKTIIWYYKITEEERKQEKQEKKDKKHKQKLIEKQKQIDKQNQDLANEILNKLNKKK